MDDYWTDAAPPRRRNWWELDETPDQQNPYPPIGLEGFRPDPPPAIGFDVQSPPTDLLGDFARSWTTPVEQGPRDAQVDPSRAAPAEDSNKSGNAFPSDGAAIGAFLGSPPIAVPEAAAGMPRVAATARLLASLAPLGPPALLAAPMIATPTNSGGDAIDLGDGRRLFWDRDSLSFDLQKGNGGLFKSGILETWKSTQDNVRDELLNNPKLDLESIRRTFGPDGVGLAHLTLKGPEPRLDTPRLDTPPSATPELAARDDAFTRRILRMFPDLIRRDTDSLAVDHFEPNEVERENEDVCRDLQKRKGEPPPDGRYEGSDKVETPFGTVAPQVGPPAATARPQDPRHDAGIRGETEMVGRIYNREPTYHVPYYGNSPGVNGPDGIVISDKRRSPMFLDSKYSSQPRAVSPSQAYWSEPDPNIVDARIRDAMASGRLPHDVGLDALGKFHLGNFSNCSGGTGEAHNGYIFHYRDGNVVAARRFR